MTRTHMNLTPRDHRDTPAEIIEELAAAFELSQPRAEHLYEAAEIDERWSVLVLPHVASPYAYVRDHEIDKLRARAEHRFPDLPLDEAVAAYVDEKLDEQQAAARAINERDWAQGWSGDRSTPHGTPYEQWLAGHPDYGRREAKVENPETKRIADELFAYLREHGALLSPPALAP
ncbi:hypothetical protein [Leucobacter aridicollis]|uniref:Uncharacterized protein n=1 Tax=Leucobacter aridicollis TaxID=283878 RepID=A0A852RC25_9MICO|nr:hypothetical protein [Leucobacter aridicollis]MBL3682027.1 hypothetical protein [Leucobacter aridicollis]NYD26926.1 hypothetical protein [Leucobacter aridicollis]